MRSLTGSSGSCTFARRGIVGAVRDLAGTIDTLSTLRSLAPKRVRSAPCQEVEETTVNLDRLPILKCWPHNGGRTITFPVVITKDPRPASRTRGSTASSGPGPDTLGMHFQVHRVGASNYRKWAARGEQMPVAAVVGADPATVFSGLAPVPEGISNFVFAGFLRSDPVELVPARSIDLEVPAQAEIVLEGYVDPTERKVEGPFGDRTGYYSAPEPFPVFHVTRVTHRAQSVYLTTVTGKPPTEDAILGKAVERVFRPVLRLVLPELVDMNLPIEGLFINVGIVSIKKAYPDHPRKVMHALWGLGQMMFVRYLVVVDDDVDVHDLSEVLYRVGLQADPGRDFELSQGPVRPALDLEPDPEPGGQGRHRCDPQATGGRFPPSVARGDPFRPEGGRGCRTGAPGRPRPSTVVGRSGGRTGS